MLPMTKHITKSATFHYNFGGIVKNNVTCCKLYFCVVNGNVSYYDIIISSVKFQNAPICCVIK